MKVVGLRELKNRLSEYVRRVRSGDEVLVSDRGEIVAQLGPPERGGTDSATPPALVALARRGLVTLGGQNEPALYPRLPRALRARTAAELLDDERGPR